MKMRSPHPSKPHRNPIAIPRFCDHLVIMATAIAITQLPNYCKLIAEPCTEHSQNGCFSWGFAIVSGADAMGMRSAELKECDMPQRFSALAVSLCAVKFLNEKTRVQNSS